MRLHCPRAGVLPLLVLLAVAVPAEAGVVARWSTWSQEMFVFERQFTSVEWFEGDLHRVDEYYGRPAERDSFERIDRPTSRRISDLAKGVQWDAHPPQRRFHLRRFVPRPSPPAGRGEDADSTSGTRPVYRLVGADSVAGMTAQHFESRLVDVGFLGMRDDSMGQVDFVFDYWVVPRTALIDEYDSLRRRVPSKASSLDDTTWTGQDTLVVAAEEPFRMAHPPPGANPDSFFVVAFGMRHELLGLSDQRLKAEQAREGREGLASVVPGVEDRQWWIARVRLVLLRREDVPATVFRLPEDYRPY